MSNQIKDVFSPTKNSRTNQEGGTWKKKELRKRGLTPKEILEMVLPPPRIKVTKLGQ